LSGRLSAIGSDKDAEVDRDERLNVTGVQTGVYDARIGFADGRIEAGQVFSIEDTDLACAN
jgi:hypothetical protein